LSDMEGSAAYVRSYLKADLRNTRTLLGLLEPVAGDGEEPAPRPELAQLEQLVHDVTVGLRERCPAGLDVDALRRFVEAESAAAARARRIADDTLAQWARSFERVLPWWSALPSVETLIAEERWPAPAPGAHRLDIAISADERFRVLGLPRTRDAIRARFEKYLSKHPGVEMLRLVDDDGDAVVTLVADSGQIKLAG
jgi:hypothetical protein